MGELGLYLVFLVVFAAVIVVPVSAMPLLCAEGYGKAVIYQEYSF